MSRQECPLSNKFPKGCKHWESEPLHDGGFSGSKGSCKFDVTKMTSAAPDSGSYGPFYVTTNCNRLGNANQPDRYEPVDNYKAIADSIDVWTFVSNRVAKGYEYDYQKHFKPILKAIGERFIKASEEKNTDSR